MLAIERRNEILEKIQIDGRVVVSELSQHYQVSEETIRRDLEKLDNEGLVTKSYGGAVLNESVNVDLPFNVRKNTNVVGKQKIATLIKELVCDEERLILDASTTAIFIAKELKERQRLSIITNSIEVLMELFDVEDWRVISTGGLAKAGSFALVGPQTDKMLRNYHVDKAIISCKGLDLIEGLSDSDDLHAHSKKVMLDVAVEKILAVDSTKFGKRAFAQIGKLSDVNKIVTDKRPSDEWLKLFDDNGIDCIYPMD
jgi:Transcriptional regulators of sugar metabolism